MKCSDYDYHCGQDSCKICRQKYVTFGIWCENCTVCFSRKKDIKCYNCDKIIEIYDSNGFVKDVLDCEDGCERQTCDECYKINMD